MTQIRKTGNRITEFLSNITHRKIKTYMFKGKIEKGLDVRSWDKDVALPDSYI
jgi:hypothetical protein